MTRVLAIPVLLLVTTCGSQHRTPEEAAAPAPLVPSDADLVRAALPSVVLVVNQRADERISYGAGFFDDRGRILTAQHVIEDPGTISVMLHKSGRASYSPMDGGILRFLFENTRELLPAKIIQRDNLSDLATLAIVGDNQSRRGLRWAGGEVHPGDRIFALGHPQETPWSFSAGVIGALQYGLIQHDATVGPGSSGGPLLNQYGEVVGVNVAQVVSEPVGLSFARPQYVVASVLGGAEKQATTIDLSSATSSALSCWRAQELALRETGECFDWETSWQQYMALLDEAAQLVDSDDARTLLRACVNGGVDKDNWIDKHRLRVVRALDPTLDKSEPELDPGDADLPPKVAQLLREGLAAKSAAQPDVGTFEADMGDVVRLRMRLRKGLRVEDTRRVAPDREWVLYGTRNEDGTVDKFSELYVRVGDRWLQRATPSREEMAHLPHSWPKPMHTFELKRLFALAYLIKNAKRGVACPNEKVDESSVKREHHSVCL